MKLRKIQGATMWSFSDSDLDVSSNHQEQFNTPCIASPFGATAPSGVHVQRKRSFNHQIGRKSNKSMSKKSLQQWLRLQEVHHRIRDCEDENEKFELYISKLFFSAFFRDLGRPITSVCTLFFFTKTFLL
jgi:hypothetical protein